MLTFDPETSAITPSNDRPLVRWTVSACPATGARIERAIKGQVRMAAPFAANILLYDVSTPGVWPGGRRGEDLRKIRPSRYTPLDPDQKHRGGTGVASVEGPWLPSSF